MLDSQAAAVAACPGGGTWVKVAQVARAAARCTLHCGIVAAASVEPKVFKKGNIKLYEKKEEKKEKSTCKHTP